MCTYITNNGEENVFEIYSCLQVISTGNLVKIETDCKYMNGISFQKCCDKCLMVAGIAGHGLQTHSFHYFYDFFGSDCICTQSVHLAMRYFPRFLLKYRPTCKLRIIQYIFYIFRQIEITGCLDKMLDYPSGKFYDVKHSRFWPLGL